MAVPHRSREHRLLPIRRGETPTGTARSVEYGCATQEPRAQTASYQKRSDTHWYCQECGVWLCHTGAESTDCFLSEEVRHPLVLPGVWSMAVPHRSREHRLLPIRRGQTLTASYQKRSDTHWYCQECGVWLCHTGAESTDCFLSEEVRHPLVLPGVWSMAVPHKNREHRLLPIRKGQTPTGTARSVEYGCATQEPRAQTASYQKRSDTHWYCQECGVWLFHTRIESTDCFLSWHKNII